MIDREALTAALNARYVGANPNVIAKAAEKYLAQLPEKCGTCEGEGWYWRFNEKRACDPCHGSGKVYPVELLERLEGDMDWAMDFDDQVSTPSFKRMVVAVLDALNMETP